MGLLASIYRSGRGDFSNGGISGQAERVCIVNIAGPFTPDEDTPAVMLVPGNLRGTVKAVPAVPIGDGYVPMAPADMIGPMDGGTYVATSDSRFGDKIAELCGVRFYGAVALHDRYETQAQYDALTR
jgi:hypothetical protein